MNYQSAIFITGKAGQELWDDVVDWWACAYKGCPAIIRLDRESLFTSDDLRGISKEMGRCT